MSPVGTSKLSPTREEYLGLQRVEHIENSARPPQTWMIVAHGHDTRVDGALLRPPPGATEPVAVES